MFYSFICNDCDNTFEIRASISEMSKGLRIICPHCNSNNVRRDYSSIYLSSTKDKSSSNSSACSGCSGNRGCCG